MKHKHTQKILRKFFTQSTAILLAFLMAFSPVFPVISPTSPVVQDIAQMVRAGSSVVSQLIARDFSTLSFSGETSILTPVRDFFSGVGSILSKYTNSEHVALTGAPLARAAVITWDGGGATNNWNDCDNWSGSTCPGTGDVATFDGTSTKNATINANISVQGIDINTGYSGIITQGAGNTVTVGSGGYDQAAGTFTGGDSAITINGAFALSAGTFTSTSGNLTIDSNQASSTVFSITGGTFNHNSGTITLRGDTGSCNCVYTVDVLTTLTTNNLTVNVTGNGDSLVIASGDTLVVEGTFTHTDGPINTGTIEAQGNVVIGASADGGTATIAFLVTGDQSITGNGGSTVNLSIDKSSGTVNAGATDLRVHGFALASGTFTSTSGNLTIDSNQASSTVFLITGGTFNHNSGTITLDGDGSSVATYTVDVLTTLTLNHLTVHVTGTSDGIAVASGDTLVVTGTFTHTDGFINTGTIEAQGDVVINSGADGGTGMIAFLVTGDQVITGNGGLTANLYIDKSAGTVNAGATDLQVRGFTLANGTFTSTSGNFTIISNLASTTVFSITGGTFNHNSGTVTFAGSGSGAATYTVDVLTTLTLSNLTVNVTGGSDGMAVASGDTLVVTGTFTQTNGRADVGTIAAQGNVVIGSSADGGTATLSFTGTNNQTYTDNGGNEPDGDITINKASGTVTLASNADWNATNQDVTVTDGTLDLAGFTLATNVLTVSDGAVLQLQGGETVTAPTKTFSSGSTVVYNGTGSYTTSLAAGNTYHHLTFNGSGGVWEPNGAVTVGGNLTVTAGTFDIDGQNLTVTGTFSNSGTLRLTGGETTVTLTNDTDSGTVEYDGGGSYASLKAGNNYYNLTFSGSGSFTAAAATDVNGDFLLSAGTFVAPATRLTVAGNFTRSGGTFTHNSGTVVLDAATGSKTLTNTQAFNNLVVNDGLVGYWKLDETTGGATATDSSGYGNDGTPNGASGGNNKPQPSTDVPDTNFADARSLDFDGTDDYVEMSDSATLDSSYPSTISFWVYVQQYGAAVDGSVLSKFSNGASSTEGQMRGIRVDANDFFFTEENTNRININTWVTAGAWHHVTLTLTAAKAATAYVDGVSRATSTFTGTWFDTAHPLRLGAAQASFFNSGTTPFDGLLNDVRIYNRALSAGEITALAAGNMPATSAATYTLGAALNVDGNLLLNSGTLDVSGSNHAVTVAGSFENNGGVFTPQSGTVTLDGTSQAINSSNTFYNLVKSVTSAATLTFGRASTQIISGALTLTGAASNLLSLVSSAVGTAWNIDPQGSRSVSYVDVSDSNNTSGTTIFANNSQSSGGGNTDWCLSAACSISGTVYTDQGITNIGANKTVAISINGAAAAATVETDSNGAYEFTGLAVSSGDVITLYLDGETEKAVTVTKINANVTGADLYQNYLITRSDNGVALTNSNLDTANNNGDTDITGTFTNSGTTITVVNGKTLLVPSGHEYTPGATLNVGSSGTSSFMVVAGGTFTQGSETINVRGNFTQSSGTFTGGSGTVDINGTFTLSSGTFTSTTGTLRVQGHWTHTGGGTFNHNNGTVESNLSSPTSVTWDVDGSETFYNFTLECNGTGSNCGTGWTRNMGSGDTFVVLNTFSHNDGLIRVGTIEVRGNMVVGSATSNDDSSNATISFLVTGDQTITGNGGKTGKLNINKSSGTVSLGSTNLTVSAVTLTSGVLTTTSGTLTISNTDSGGNSWTHTSGTFNHNNGTVMFGTGAAGQYCGTLDVPTSDNFYNFTHAFSTNVACTMNSGERIIIENTYTNTTGIMNAGTIEVQGDVIIASSATGGTSMVDFTGTNNQTYTDQGGNEPDGDITINKASGTVTLASNADWNATSQDVTVTDGTLDLAGFTLATNALTISDTLQLQGGETLTTTSKTVNSGSTIIFTGDGDAASDTYVITDKFTDYHHLTLNSTDGATDTFRTNANITVAGNWTRTAGTFDATTNSNTVTLDGTNQTLTGDTTFYNLTKTESADDATDETLTFAAGDTFTITNTWTLDGRDADDRINLVSSSPGTTWNIDPRARARLITSK
jgi:hypothetical protein